MDINEVQKHLQSVISAGKVLSGEDEIASYNVVNPIIEDGNTPFCVVRPHNLEELQNVLKKANELSLNLTIVSSTGRHIRGGFLGNKENIIIDLSSWKKIDWIDRRNRVCMITPGVTYEELLKELKPHGLSIPLPLAPRSSKSVVAAVMDREPTTWPNKQWDIGDPVASTEFLFGSGELFRTGAAGGPGSLDKQREVGGAQKCPTGPSQTDFHRVVQGAQGTMGIVTWITMRAELIPSIQKPFLIGHDSLEKIIPFVYEVQRPWLGEHSFILSRSAAAMLMCAQDTESIDSVIESLPEYICLQNIAGFERLPKARIKYQELDIGDIALKYELSMEETAGKVNAAELLNKATSPCGDIDWRHALTGQCLSLFFLTTLDLTPKFVDLFNNLVRENDIDGKYIGVYIQPVVQNHACHVEFMVPYDQLNDSTVDKMKRFEKEAVTRLAEAGAFFSRPYGAANDVSFQQNPLAHDVLKKIKSIFDPNKVLNNGKWNL